MKGQDWESLWFRHRQKSSERGVKTMNSTSVICMTLVFQHRLLHPPLQETPLNQTTAHFALLLLNRIRPPLIRTQLTVGRLNEEL